MRKVLLLFIVVMLGGCSFLQKSGSLGATDKNAAVNEEKKIIIYSSENPQKVAKVIEKFKSAQPQYEIEVRQIEGEDAVQEMKQHRKEPQGDLWWGGTAAQLIAGKKEKLFRPIPINTAVLVSSFYRDSENEWMGETLFPQAFVTSYATSGELLPWQWENLALPRHEKQLLFLHPGLDRNYRVWLGSVMYRKGFFQPEVALRWLLGLDANTERYFTDERALMEIIAAYPGKVTWMDLSNALKWREKEKFPIKIYLPQGSQPVYFTGIALLKNNPHPRGSELFLQFLYSDEIQGMLMKEYLQFSAKEQVASSFRPSWYDEWSVSPQDLDWEWIAEMQKNHLFLWETEVEGRGVVIPSPTKKTEEIEKVGSRRLY